MTGLSHQQETRSTIAAIATARGQGGVAITRVSGPNAWDVARKLFVGGKTLKPPEIKASRIFHGWITSQESQSEFLDEVILLAFKAPNSFTGEDVIEIQGHGGDYLSHLILERCLGEGAILAQPGEFTKRAFLNGKMDLTQAESVMDLVSANNERLLHVASSNLKNRSLGLELDKMREQLIQLQMHLIAHTDFPDEVDPPDKQKSLNELETLIQIISDVAQSAERNRIIREGFQVAILGLPNSGKSSLFNILLSSDRAIVTDIAGTTRDVITETLMLDGVNVTLLDTAGIRETENTVEKIGIERSWLAASQAQAVLYVYDATIGLIEEDKLNLGQLCNLPTLMLANKCDLKSTEAANNLLPISAKTGQGITEILSWLEKEIHSQVSQDETSTALSLNQRQRNCVQNILNHLSLVHQTLSSPHLPLDLATVPLSDALYEFDKLSGRDTTEEVLDEVFSQFCVGK